MKKTSNELLLVVDYQNDFVIGALSFDGAEKLDSVIAKKVREYGENKVIYALDTHGADYLETREGRALPIAHCISGTEGHEVYGETKIALEEVNAIPIEKVTFGVHPSDIGLIIEEEPTKIEIVGLVTNMCVISNVCVLQAMYPECQIVVDSKGCASFDGELHEKTLDVLKGLQVQVI